MTKRIIFLLALVMSLCAVAQNGVGDWRIHTSFVSNQVTGIAETRNWVYYLSSGNLFRLDKDTQENESLSLINDLSDMGISQIHYNSNRDYLLVVYSNSNLDIITSDGSVVNMPEIKDAVMTADKTINDVTFAPGEMYIAAGFGYLVIDDNKFVVKESHLYGDPITSVAKVGNKILLSTSGNFYYGDADAYHETLASFRTASLKNSATLRPISDSTFYCTTSRVYLATMTDVGNGKMKFPFDTIIDGKATIVQSAPGGFLLNVPSLEKCFKTDLSGRNPEATDTEGELCSCHPDGNGTLWAVGPLGLHQLGSESYYLPNAITYDLPFWMTYNKSQDLLYVTPPTANGFFGTTRPTAVCTYDGIKWNDVTPEGAPQRGCYWIEFLPDASNTYFLGTWRDGLLKVVDNEIVFKFDSINSPLAMRGGRIHPITSIDRYGNVWVVQPYENRDHPVMVLPAAKAKQSEPLKSDWVLPEIEGIFTNHTQRGRFLSTRYSNYDIKIFTDGDFEMPVFFWNSNGELSLHPQQESFNYLVDQDGLPFTWTNILCFTEDLNGIVWMGCTEGVVSFNPAQAFSGDFRVNHIKVPRNDGTNMADYLLDGIQVNDVAVDGANRKWIATQSSGLFLVSADGTQILARFNETNSPLASNTVYRVCCNPNSNSVYVTTPAGLYEYFSDSGPAESSYDNIYAYPNPVRPDYMGNVTLVGMMDNTLVKIADASGNVIRQLKSTGGMATWDCCDQYGERVKTGVYLVLCSQSNGSGEAVVTKIAVVR